MLKNPKRIIVCEKSPERIQFVREHYPDVLITTPENCKEFVLQTVITVELMLFWKWRGPKIVSGWRGTVPVPMR